MVEINDHISHLNTSSCVQPNKTFLNPCKAYKQILKLIMKSTFIQQIHALLLYSSHAAEKNNLTMIQSTCKLVCYDCQFHLKVENGKCLIFVMSLSINEHFWNCCDVTPSFRNKIELAFFKIVSRLIWGLARDWGPVPACIHPSTEFNSTPTRCWVTLAVIFPVGGSSLISCAVSLVISMSNHTFTVPLINCE